LKLALALLWEHREECPEAVPVIVCHDEIVVECDESDVKKVEAWLKKAMEDGIDEVRRNRRGSERPQRRWSSGTGRGGG
jgi:hypothetical protein